MRALLTVAAVSVITTIVPFSRSADAAEVSRVISVSGQGVVEVVPDQVVVSMTTSTVDDDLMRVREDSDKQARTVLDLAKEHGASSEQFDVNRLDLKLRFSNELRRYIYEVERDVAVTLSDLSRVDSLLSHLLNEPGVKIKGIQFGSGRARESQIEARRRAVAEATETAAHLAELTGLKLGKPTSIRLTGQSQRPFATSVIPVIGAAQPEAGGGADPFGMPSGQSNPGVFGHDATLPSPFRLAAFQNQPPTKKAEADEATGQPFGLGMINITANVHIDFELLEPTYPVPRTR